MTTNVLEQKKKFIVVAPDEKVFKTTAEAVNKHVTNASVLPAHDGFDALSKINNDPPNVVILSTEIPKLSASQLIAEILNVRGGANIAIILMSEIPDQESFVDEVVTGRLQHLNDLKDDQKVARIIMKALTFSFHGEKTEFTLKFLAPGDVLLQQGAKAEAVYIVRKGTLKAILKKGSEEVLLGNIEAGEFVGEMAYINGEPRSADVIATSDCELIEIPVDHLDHLLFLRPAWSLALMKTLSKRVKRANQTKTK